MKKLVLVSKSVKTRCITVLKEVKCKNGFGLLSIIHHYVNRKIRQKGKSIVYFDNYELLHEEYEFIKNINIKHCKDVIFKEEDLN